MSDGAGLKRLGDRNGLLLKFLFLGSKMFMKVVMREIFGLGG